MKTTAMKTVWIMTSYVLLFTTISLANPRVEYIMALFAVGVIFIPYMVVKVLRDGYHTSKTFSDWYEDQSKGQ